MVSVSGINEVKVTEDLSKVIEEMGGKGPNLLMEVPVLPLLMGLPVLKEGPEQEELLPSKEVNISVVEDEEENMTSGSGEEEEGDEYVVQDVTMSGELSSLFGKDANELQDRLDNGGIEGLDSSSFSPMNNSTPLKKEKRGGKRVKMLRIKNKNWIRVILLGFQQFLKWS